MKSKEDDVLELFFDNPTREWHFEEFLTEIEISRGKLDDWLKKFLKAGLIKKIREKGEMPYYISNHGYNVYKNKKRLFALNKLYDSGLLNHLSSLEDAKSVILFGSFARSDWYKNSDIDIFIYGSSRGLKIVDYELKLHRDIQVFTCASITELKKFGDGLIRNIIKGNLIKGDIDFIKVDVNA
jgi:predicted nucleotidyltransferase